MNNPIHEQHPSRKILIKNAWLISNAARHPHPFRGWLTVQGNHIAALGEGDNPATEGVDEIMDGEGCALLPGLCNLHAHSHSSLTRGSAEGLSLQNWLQRIEREQTYLTEEQAYIGALGTYAEALLSGTTCLVDMCLFPEAAVQAAQKIGIRATIVPYIADTKPFTPTLERVEDLISEKGKVNSERIKVWCGLHDLESCSDDQIRQVVRLAEAYRVGIHMHCAETIMMVDKTLARTSKRPVFQLEALGVLGPTTLLAHCVWVNAEERLLLAKTNTNVTHCPHANLKLGSGVAPVPEMLASGVKVGLGTDGAKANNRLDMFDVMKFASLIHRGTHLDATLLPSENVFSMASRVGYQVLGWQGGTLEPGNLADLTMVQLSSFHLQPATPDTIVANLVYAARGSDVTMVMANGSLLVKNGRITTVDNEALLQQFSHLGQQLLN